MHFGVLLSSDVGWWPVSVALYDPLFIVDALELEQGLAQFLDRVEPADPEQVLFQRPNEAFRAAVALRRAVSHRLV